MSSSLPVGRTAALAAALAPAAFACALIVPLSEGPLPVADAAVSVNERCGPLPVPPSPRHAASKEPLTFASVRWTLEPNGDPAVFCPSFGFDLDGRNTQGAPRCEQDRACEPHPLAAAQRAFPCDGPAGEDNAFYTLYGVAKALPGGGATARAFDVESVNAAGLLAVVIALHDYSGEANDEHVQVHFYNAVGIEGLDAGVTRDTNPGEVLALPPVWDGGQDVAWVVGDDSVVGSGSLATARVRADGYVTDDTLVVPNAGAIGVPLGLGRAVVARDAVLIGHLERPATAGARHRLSHVRIGARVASAELLSAVGGLTNPLRDKTKLCEAAGRTEYEAFFRAPLCAHMDLPTGGRAPSPEARCGDLSFGVNGAFVESRLSRRDNGDLLIGRLPIGVREPCRDDAGTTFCDDCDWEGPRRCPAGDAAPD